MMERQAGVVVGCGGSPRMDSSGAAGSGAAGSSKNSLTPGLGGGHPIQGALKS